LLGSWVISGIELAPITAVPADKAASQRGQSVVLGTTTANFAGAVCSTPRYTATTAKDGTRVEVSCTNDAIIPNFYIDQGGNISARLDGVNYELTRR